MTVNILIILGMIAFVLMWGNVYLVWRNDRVYEYRIRTFEQRGLAEYRRLPSYKVMVYKFWVWPLEKFKK